jgi:hypothetical protein
MTLYSADVFDLAKPVLKKGKGKKTAAVEPVPVLEQSATETAVAVLEKPVKEKKPPTEKQLAALAKAQESRKRKREEAEQAKLTALEVQKAAAAAEEEKKRLNELKKLAAKEKRLAKKQQQQVPTPAQSLDEEIDVAVKELAPAPKKQKVVDENEPPAWFKQYVAGVKKEEDKMSSEKKPKKQIQKEAVEVAQKNWNDEFTRHRVRNEVDGHMSRMYQMMFAGRKMK